MAEGKSFLTVDIVQQHYQAAADVVAKDAARDYLEHIGHELSDSEYSAPLESPLEALFFLWWHAALGDSASYWANRLQLDPQREVQIGESTFRLDFVVCLLPHEDYEWMQTGLKFPDIAVELDGHSYHEKTVEQVTRRNQRDRVLQQAGWTVFHFSFYEMVGRPQGCVEDVLSVAQKTYQKILQEHWTKGKAAELAAANQEGVLTSQES